MTDAASSPAAQEHERVREAYARRVSSDPRYSWFNMAHLFTIQRRERATLRCLQRNDLRELSQMRILEIGCGEGFWLRELIKWGANATEVYGLDLLQHRVQVARALGPSRLNLLNASATDMPFPSGTFDMLVQSTVFTSILSDDIRRAVATEMCRVIRPGGAILWYDYVYDNPRNPDVRAVKKREIASLFPGASINLQRVTLAPPLARAVVPRSWGAAVLLEAMPSLRTHLLGVIRPCPKTARSS